jgi:uncharacterized RDD family membrane protein YckC
MLRKPKKMQKITKKQQNFLYCLIMDWYYIDSSKPEGKRRNGPWSPRQMLSFAEQGAFAAETLVWRDGFENWKPWSTAEPELKDEFKGKKIDVVEDKKALPSDLAKASYASLGLRFCAFTLDLIIMQFIFILLTPLHGYFGVISPTPQTTPQEFTPSVFFFLGIMLFYGSFFVKQFSGTPGKIALRLAVVRSNGEPMTWNCAFLRSVAVIFSLLSFGIGCLLAVFDSEKRTMHDFIANTKVLKVETVN